MPKPTTITVQNLIGTINQYAGTADQWSEISRVMRELIEFPPPDPRRPRMRLVPCPEDQPPEQDFLHDGNEHAYREEQQRRVRSRTAGNRLRQRLLLGERDAAFPQQQFGARHREGGEKNQPARVPYA